MRRGRATSGSTSGLRGYAIVSAVDGVIVEDASTLHVGDDVDIAFAHGNAGATIRKI